MIERTHSSRWSGVVLVLLLLELVLSAPQGYTYYSHQQRINAQRLQAQRLQAQRLQAQRRYQQASTPTRKTVSRADMENAKFLGVQNQEADDAPRTFNLIRRKKQFVGGNPCYFRSADQPKAEGRFLWDLNVHNYYTGPGVNCGGYGSGFGGGFNPFNGYPPYGGYGPYGRPNRGFFQNFLSLFLPGGALNPNVGPVRLQSPVQSDSTGSGGIPSGAQNDLSIDPSLDGTGTGVSTGNIGSSGSINGGGGVPVQQGTNLTPGQLVGGVASTVNGIIQTLSGNPGYTG